jgi:hypothetical protein
VLFPGHQAQSNSFAMLHPLEALGKPFNTEERSKRRNSGEEKGFLRVPLFFPFHLHVPELKKDLLRQTHAARGKRRNRKTQQ